MDHIRRMGRIQRAGILHMVTVDNICQCAYGAPVIKPDAELSLQIDVGNEFALSQIVKHRVRVFRSRAKRHATAGAATIEAKDQARLFLRAPVHPGAHAKGAPVPVQAGRHALDRFKARIPHQRTVAKHPKIVHFTHYHPWPFNTVAFQAADNTLETIMAVSSQPDPSPASRKVWMLGIVIVAFIGVYTGAWFYGAREIRSRLETFMKIQEQAGFAVACGDMQVKGYPFRFEVFCTSPGFADLSNGSNLNAAALRTAAQVYAPWHIVWEMDGPLDATVTGGEKLQLNWKALQSSLSLKTRGISRSSLTSEGLTLSVPSGPPAQALQVSAEHGEAHIRQNGEDLDLAALFRSVKLTLPTSSDAKVPEFSASFDMAVHGKAGALDGRLIAAEILHPGTGELRRLVADFGGGRVATLSGPFSVNEQGLLSGKLSLVAEKFVGWEPLLKAGIPDSADTISTAFGAIKAMADKQGTVRVNLVIEQGQVMLGFIPLGLEIPPL